MNIKRLLTGIIGFALVLPFLVFGNKYMVDIAVAIVAIIGIREFSKCAKNKGIKVITWIGYVLSILIIGIHILPVTIKFFIILIGFPLIMLILFLHTIFTNMEINFKDISITLFGIAYIVGFLVFLALLYGIESINWNIDGKALIWYVLFASWGSDTCAYIIGKNFGKHKFSRISPNKTIEGCVGGIVGSVIGGLIYTLAINNLLGACMPYLFATIILIIFSIIGQLGDFVASVIKRYFEVKDFSELFPGHGGMLDRMDSIIFISPFAYILFTLINLLI